MKGNLKKTVFFIHILYLLTMLLSNPIKALGEKKEGADKNTNGQDINGVNKKEFGKAKLTRKTVQGLHGNPRVLAELWLDKQSKFISLSFEPGKDSKFLPMGILSGTLKDGKIISIEIQQDFLDGNSGMIHDHLRTLRHRSEVEALGKKKLKVKLNLKRDIDLWMKRNERKWDKKRRLEITNRLDLLLHDEKLSSTEKKVIKDLEKKLEPQVRQRIISQVEKEIRSHNPHSSENQLKKLVTHKIDKELDDRVKLELKYIILSEKNDGSPEWLKAKPLIHRVVSQHRSAILAEVNAEYAVSRLKYEETMKKKFYKRGKVWIKKKEPGIFEKVISRTKGLLDW